MLMKSGSKFLNVYIMRLKSESFEPTENYLPATASALLTRRGSLVHIYDAYKSIVRVVP